MNADWTSSNIARYAPEAAVHRFRRVMPDTLFAKSLFVGQAYLYAGFANRLLGENFCQSVIPVETPDPTQYRLSPGSLGPQTLYFQRADTAFTNAIAVFIASGLTDTGTTSLLRAAYAGRASVRADLATYGLAQWADVLTDAALVPNTAVFQAPYAATSPDQYNYLYWARANQSFRAHTQWGTFYEGYYRTTRDPRVRWDTTGLQGDAAVAKFGGRVPFWPEAKYATTSAPVRLASGCAIRLLDAAIEGRASRHRRGPHAGMLCLRPGKGRRRARRRRGPGVALGRCRDGPPGFPRARAQAAARDARRPSERSAAVVGAHRCRLPDARLATALPAHRRDPAGRGAR